MWSTRSRTGPLVWLSIWVGISATASIACGPGDHAQQGNLDDLFGRGGAGATAREEDDGVISDDGAIVSTSAGTGPLGSGGTGGAAGRNGTTNVPPTAGASGGSAGSTGSGGMGPSRGMPAVSPPMSDGPAAPMTADSGACEPGYVEVGGECVCDLNGTFALHGAVTVAFAGTAPIEALNDTIDFWGIVRQEYSANGNLAFTLTSCGQTTPDICADAQAPIIPAPEAYGQYVPVEVWDKRAVDTTAQLAIPAATPGAAFNTPTLVLLSGVSLANPLGAWPRVRGDVEGGPDFDGSAVNGARWVDGDGDGKLGVSTLVVGPTGATATATSGPPRSYGATSDKCPRTNPRATRSPYAYFPMSQGIGVRRVKGYQTAQRLALELHGTLASCDRMDGRFTGPNAGNLRVDAVMGGCMIVNGSSEMPCSAAMLDTAESSGGGSAIDLLELGTGDFVLSRVAEDITCAQVRTTSSK